MPYQIAYDGPVLLIRMFDAVTPADLDAAADEVFAIEDEGRNTPPRLTDLRDVTDAQFSYADVARLAERARSRPLAAPVKSAVVVAQPVQLGFARMFQILNEHPHITMRIFDDAAEARRWLAGAASDNGLTASTSGDIP
jgi:hypothetical protein